MERLVLKLTLLLATCLGFVFFAQSAQAASSSAGQSIIANLEKGANGGRLQVNPSDLNQAKNYINSANTPAVTAAQAAAANNDIDQVRAIIEKYSPNATNYSEAVHNLPASARNQIRQIVYTAARVLGLSVLASQGTGGSTSSDTNNYYPDSSSNGNNGTNGANGVNGTDGANGSNSGSTAAGTNGANGTAADVANGTSGSGLNGSNGLISYL